MSHSTIMSVREMIDAAFGEPDVNVVNFKLIQTILYLLARQLRLLERKVGIELDIKLFPAESSISITEVKLQARVAKQRKKPPTSGGPATQGRDRGIRTGPPGTTPLKAIPHQLATDRTSGPSSLSKSTTEQSSTDRTLSTTDKTTSSKSTTDKTSSSKSTTDKTTTSKSTTDETSTTKSFTDKTSSSKSTTDGPSSKSTTDKTSSSKSTTDKTSSSKSTTDEPSSKSTTDKTTSSKSTTDKTSSSKSTTEPTSTSTKTSTEMSSSDRTKSSSDRKRSSVDKSSSSDSGRKRKFTSQEYHHLLELVEQERERELRVVTQRADSREVAERTPTPMASLDSMEVQYEKLLVVERVPTEEAKKRIGLPGDTKLSVVTQDEFDKLSQTVKELQKKFGLVGEAKFPENMQLMQELRRGASLTDAMAALQLSARLEAAEKALTQMTSLVTDLAVQKGIDKEAFKPMAGGIDKVETKVIFGAQSDSSQKSKKSSQKHSEGEEPEETLQIRLSDDATPLEHEAHATEILDELPKVPPDCVKLAELEEAMEEVYDNLKKSVGSMTNKALCNSEDALKIARRLEGKLNATIGLDQRMIDLELFVSEYAGQINTLDASLSSQMTNYQEQLTQMQHDLESGLEAMVEALANPAGDTAGAAELNANFSNLLQEFEVTNGRQKELQEHQGLLAIDVQALWREIEKLREIKSDREEVADALRDKAGLGALNGLVTQQQFDAVRGDFEKRIGASYDKFNNQEIVWQKLIDELWRELNERADWIQVVSLRDNINENIGKLNAKLNAMIEIVGEPHAAAISRTMFRDSACISCATPAHMHLNETTLPALPAFPKHKRLPAIGAEDSTKPKEDGDHVLCYPGRPIPHPMDPRAHVCNRYCGGSHTAVRPTLSRAPTGIKITTFGQETTGIGSDGRVYKMEIPERDIKPCRPCNFQKEIAEPPEGDEAPKDYLFDSDVTPSDILPRDQGEEASVTPPPPSDSD